MNPTMPIPFLALLAAVSAAPQASPPVDNQPLVAARQVALADGVALCRDAEGGWRVVAEDGSTESYSLRFPELVAVIDRMQELLPAGGQVIAAYHSGHGPAVYRGLRAMLRASDALIAAYEAAIRALPGAELHASVGGHDVRVLVERMLIEGLQGLQAGRPVLEAQCREQAHGLREGAIVWSSEHHARNIAKLANL
jgi:hypothetical protein